MRISDPFSIKLIINQLQAQQRIIQSYNHYKYMLRLFKFIRAVPIKYMDCRPRFYFTTGKDPRSQQTQQSHESQLDKYNKILDNNQEEMKEGGTTGYILVGGVIVLTMAYMLMQIQGLRGDKKANRFKAGRVEGVGKADIGGEWQLIDTKGKVVTHNDLKGSYYLIYFGFCNCPDICPNSLMKLKKAVERIKKTPESRLFKLKSIFVSVDPDRDTPEKIDKFISYFDPQMIGLTGKSNNDPLLKDCLKKFKIYSTKIQYQQEPAKQEQEKLYTIDHTILTYLIDDQNNYLAHLGANLGEHQLSKAILDNIVTREKSKY